MESWKRNLWVIWAAELVAIAGFSVVSPFLPYFVQDLGITGVDRVGLWSSALFAAQAVTMTIFSPIWGALSDRFGRKVMVQRAMFGGALVFLAMGFVQNVWQLLALRALQGVLTGTVAAATTLVASTTPRHRAGYALGMLQMAIWVGSSLGPMLGGFVADMWGYRAAFWVTGSLLFFSGVTVRRLVHEDFAPARDAGKPTGGLWHGFQLVLRDRGLMGLLSVRVMARLASSTMTPILPLFIQSLVAVPDRVASTAGLISGVSAATSAIAAVVLGRAGDRKGYRRILLTCVALAVALYIPHYFVSTIWQLLLLQASVGIAMSGMLSAISALMANLAPEGYQGSVYGADSTATSLASGIGPMAGASLAAVSGLRMPFLLSALLYAIAATVTWRVVPRSSTRKDPVPADKGQGPPVPSRAD